MNLLPRILPLFLAPLLAAGAVEIGSERQLFIDHDLLDELRGADLRLHPPCPREIVLVRDAPWEGSGSDYERIIRDGPIIRLYYMGSESTSVDGRKIGPDRGYACVAYGTDGIHWTKPDLGLFDFGGSRQNNIVWSEPHLDNFTPFLDTNPACPPDERYKATSGFFRRLYAFASADGVHWSRLSSQPIITHGIFDTQNNAFWDPLRKHYWSYIRGYHDKDGRDITGILHGTVGIRDIRVATSADFRHWTDPKRLEYVGCPEVPLYTNQIEPYYRAPRIFLGFPTRYNDRKFSPAAMRSLPDPIHRQRRMKFVPRYGTVVTDGQFMTSRDGYSFHRWDETFIRPGPERRDNWLYGDGYQSLGLLETAAADPTAPPELSCYATEDEWKRPTRLRRYTLRVDGFVSIHAPQEGGTAVTKPLIFSGRRLSLNFSTSAGGAIRVEVERADGSPIPGRSLGDCDELFGDTLDRTVTWKDQPDLGPEAGRPVRLRFTLVDADLYSLKFEE